MIQFVEECAIAGNCETVQEDDGKGWMGSAVRRRDDGGDEGSEMRGGQAINTTQRHARRQATPKARFIRARTKGRRVDFYPENPPTAGSLVSNYRNAAALENSCRASLSLSTLLAPLYDHHCQCGFIYRTNVSATDSGFKLMRKGIISFRVYSSASSGRY